MGKRLLPSLILLLLISCSTYQRKERNPYQENKAINLLAFIGKKISVEEFDPNDEREQETYVDSITGEKFIRKSFIMDNAFRCRYVVIKNVFNDLQCDTINFIAYDHYGDPEFVESEYVLLYISRDKVVNKYFHKKYQYDVLKKDSEGYFYGRIYGLREDNLITQTRKLSPTELVNRKKTKYLRSFLI